MKKLDIIYEDKEILVVNKPAKLLTVATTKEKERTLYHEAREYLHKKNQLVFIVHRLDKDTSGIVLFAKTEEIKNLLQRDWLSYKREYIAICSGHLPKKKDTLRLYLAEDNHHHVYVQDKGERAVTEYEVLDTNKTQSLVKVIIKTGKKQQIRASLDYIGNTIVGDKKYNSKINSLSRLGLHANKLVIKHPKTKKEMVFISKVPKVFLLGFPEFVDKL